MHKTLLLLLLTFAIAATACPDAPEVGPGMRVPEITKPHPRLILDQQDLEAMRERVRSGHEPFISAWEKLRNSAEAGLARDPRPYEGDEGPRFWHVAWRESEAARDMALAWHITFDDRYALGAIRYIQEWATNVPIPGAHLDPERKDPGIGMYVARSTMPFIYAYDLLHDHPGWEPEARYRVESWFRIIEMNCKIGSYRWRKNNYYNEQYYQNHLVSDTMGMLLVGYVLGDRNLVQQAVSSEEYERDVFDLMDGLILMPGDTPHKREPAGLEIQPGEIYDRYRHHTGRLKGLQYSHLSLTLMTVIAEVLRNNGIDLYSYEAPGGEKLELSWAFYSDFYSTMRSDIKGGFYAGEDERMTRAGDKPTLFEIGALRYPELEGPREVLKNIDRAGEPLWLFGWPVLTHGIILEENE